MTGISARLGSAALALALAAGAVTAKPTVFPEPTRYDSKPFTVPHDDDVLAVAYSPDGAILAVACADKTVRLRDPATGKLLATLSGHADAVAAVAFSRDGTKLATASYDKLVKVWDVAGRKELAALAGHTNAVLAVAFLPDGKTVVSGGADRLLKVWDAATGAEKGSFEEHRGAVRGSSRGARRQARRHGRVGPPGEPLGHGHLGRRRPTPRARRPRPGGGLLAGRHLAGVRGRGQHGPGLGRGQEGRQIPPAGRGRGGSHRARHRRGVLPAGPTPRHR
jgi:hypothetical protein